MDLIDLTGNRFGDLTVVRRVENKNGTPRWECICECGNKTIAYGGNLKSGKTKSCGCGIGKKAKETMTTHGLSDTRPHIIWIQMRARCEKPNNPAYKDYGGRGISVCEDWMDFQNFYNWAMGNGYSKDLTIDRINNNGNYDPNNCRWATQKQQARNTRKSRLITYNKETHCIAEWSEITGIQRDVIVARLDKLKWNTEDALTKPIQRRTK